MSEFIEKVLAKNVLFTNMPLDIEIKEKVSGNIQSILYEYNIDLNLAKIGMPIHKGAYIKILEKLLYLLRLIQK